MNKLNILCFCGADGSGKSTLARLYAVLLKQYGYKVRIVWVRGTHTFSSFLAHFLSKYSAFHGYCNPYYNICIPSKLKRLWMWIEFISLLPILFARFIIPKIFGYFIIGERGFIDFIVWLIITLRSPYIVNSFIGRFILSLARYICINIYVRARLDVLKARRRGSPEESLLQLELSIYDVFARMYKIPTIDTSNKDIIESFKQFLKVLYSGGDSNEFR